MSWDNNHPNTSGISLEFRNSSDDKRKKQDDDLRLFKELTDRGYPDDAAQYIIDKRNQTGKLDLNLPTYKNAAMKGLDSNVQPPRGEENLPGLYYDQMGGSPNRPVSLPPVPGVPERSTLMDFKPMKKDSFAITDPNNPRNMSFLPVPDDVNVKHVVSGASNMDGENIYIDASTGDEIRREKNGTKTTKTIKIGSTNPNPNTRPDVELAKKVLVDLQKDIDDGIPIEPARLERAKTAAAVVGNVSVGQEPDVSTVEQPGFIPKLFGAKPVTHTTPGNPIVKYGKNGINKNNSNESYQSAEDVRAAFQAGKIDRETAKKILQSQFGHK